MPEIRLDLRGGIDVELSPTANRGGWSQSNLIRWREGKVEKIRGWMRISAENTLPGVCRALHNWYDLNLIAHLAAGTNTALKLLQDGIIYDITPIGFAPGTISSTAGQFTLLIWSLDNFGQDLLAVPSGGTVYVWTPPTLTTRANAVNTAPPHNQGGFMTMPQQIFMVYGSSPDGGKQDPMLIRWCDQSNFTSWDPTTTNFAGSFRLSRGSRIVGGVQSPLGAFLWTDIDVWATQYEGFPLVFGFYQIGANAGAIAQKAISIVGSVPYWMSDHGFFRMGGEGVEQITCPVWDKVYLNLDDNNSDKCFAEVDYIYSTITWWYPSKSGNTGEIDSYIQYNFQENLWDYGTRIKTASTDQNHPGPPLFTDLSGQIFQQDIGLDGDGVPIVAMAQSAFQDIQDGSQLFFADQFIPDFIFDGEGPDVNGPQVDVTLFFRSFPNETPTAVGPFTIRPTTGFVTLATQNPAEPGIIMRPRGREWAIRLDWTALDSWARYGTPRLRIAPDGSGRGAIPIVLQPLAAFPRGTVVVSYDPVTGIVTLSLPLGFTLPPGTIITFTPPGGAPISVPIISGPGGGIIVTVPPGTPGITPGNIVGTPTPPPAPPPDIVPAGAIVVSYNPTTGTVTLSLPLGVALPAGTNLTFTDPDGTTVTVPIISPAPAGGITVMVTPGTLGIDPGATVGVGAGVTLIWDSGTWNVGTFS